MNHCLVRALGTALLFSGLSISAVALPGDATAVLAHCGPPSSDQVLHQDTAAASRVISYSDIELYFSRENGDWGFSSAKRASMPLPQDQLFSTMHCVSDALEENAIRPPQPVAATTDTPASTAAATQSTVDHTAIFEWVGGIVLVGIIFFAIRPYAKSEPVKPPAPVAPRAPRRRPSATGIKFRKPEDVTPATRRLDKLSLSSRQSLENVPRGTLKMRSCAQNELISFIFNDLVRFRFL